MKTLSQFGVVAGHLVKHSFNLIFLLLSSCATGAVFYRVESPKGPAMVQINGRRGCSETPCHVVAVYPIVSPISLKNFIAVYPIETDKGLIPQGSYWSDSSSENKNVTFDLTQPNDKHLEPGRRSTEISKSYISGGNPIHTPDTDVKRKGLLNGFELGYGHEIAESENFLIWTSARVFYLKTDDNLVEEERFKLWGVSNLYQFHPKIFPGAFVSVGPSYMRRFEGKNFDSGTLYAGIGVMLGALFGSGENRDHENTYWLGDTILDIQLDYGHVAGLTGDKENFEKFTFSLVFYPKKEFSHQD